MSRVFSSDSSRDNRHAIALKRWLERAEPGLIGEIYLDLDRFQCPSDALTNAPFYRTIVR